jgi:hypothetical protein
VSSNTSRVILVLGAALALQAGAQSIRADFQNEVYPTAGYRGTSDIMITMQDDPDGDENANYHSRTYLAADGFCARQSSLMRFAVDPAKLPSGASIIGANLNVFVTNETFSGFSIYEVLRPWDQSKATFLEPKDGQSWAVPGADGEGVDRGSTPLSTWVHLDAGYDVIGVTDAGVDLVRRWFNGTTPNNGVIVQDYNSWDKMIWGSSESTQPPFLVLSLSDDTTAQVPVTEDTMIAYQPTSWDGWGLGFSGRPTLLTASLVRWDLRAIPPGVQIGSAGMTFTVNKLAAKSSAIPFDVYPALVPWTETATWLTYDGKTPWAVAGAQGLDLDHGPRVGSFPSTCSTPQSVCAVTFPGLAALVQQWVDDPANNQGVLMQNYVNMDDLQLMDSEWPVPGLRPKLTVAFTWDAGRPPGLYPAYAEVYPNERVQMKAFGGAGAYQYSVSGISGSTIDQAGLYTAGTFAGQDQVRVVDQGGGGVSAFATIVVLTNATPDAGTPITITFPDPPAPVPPQKTFAVVADITSRTTSTARQLGLDVSGQALTLEGASLVGGGPLAGDVDAGFLLPVLDTGATLQVSITGTMRAVPSDSPSMTATVRSGPVVVASATTPVPLDAPPAISTGCGCGSTTGGMGVVVLAGILQIISRGGRKRHRLNH